jgi:hypothetical protein
MANHDQERAGSLLASLKSIWNGKSSKNLYLKYFFIAIGIYIAGIIIGISLYPGGFDFMTVYVSYLGGDPDNSVAGRNFYNTSVIIAGIMLVPHFIFMYRRLTPACKVISYLSCLCGIVGALGFASIGIFYQGFNARMHQITTWIAYGGLGASAVFMLFAFIRKAVMTKTWPKWWHIVLVYAQAFLTIGLTFLLQPWFGDHLSEWLYTFAFMFWLPESVLIVPKDVIPAGA